MKTSVKSLAAAAVLAVGILAMYAPVAAAQTGPCRDPWINQVYSQRLHRAPIGMKNPSATHARNDYGECNCNLYAGCAWNSYGELESAIVSWDGYTRQTRLMLQPMGSGIAALLNGSPIGMMIRNAAGQIFDINGHQKSGYSLQSAGSPTTLGKTTIVLSR